MALIVSTFTDVFKRAELGPRPPALPARARRPLQNRKGRPPRRPHDASREDSSAAAPTRRKRPPASPRAPVSRPNGAARSPTSDSAPAPPTASRTTSSPQAQVRRPVAPRLSMPSRPPRATSQSDTATAPRARQPLVAVASAPPRRPRPGRAECSPAPAARPGRRRWCSAARRPRTHPRCGGHHSRPARTRARRRAHVAHVGPRRRRPRARRGTRSAGVARAVHRVHHHAQAPPPLTSTSPRSSEIAEQPSVEPLELGEDGVLGGAVHDEGVSPPAPLPTASERSAWRASASAARPAARRQSSSQSGAATGAGVLSGGSPPCVCARQVATPFIGRRIEPSTSRAARSHVALTSPRTGPAADAGPWSLPPTASPPRTSAAAGGARAARAPPRGLVLAPDLRGRGRRPRSGPPRGSLEALAAT